MRGFDFDYGFGACAGCGTHFSRMPSTFSSSLCSSCEQKRLKKEQKALKKKSKQRVRII